jgi:hypothetical protein
MGKGLVQDRPPKRAVELGLEGVHESVIALALVGLAHFLDVRELAAQPVLNRVEDGRQGGVSLVLGDEHAVRAAVTSERANYDAIGGLFGVIVIADDDELDLTGMLNYVGDRESHCKTFLFPTGTYG